MKAQYFGAASVAGSPSESKGALCHGSRPASQSVSYSRRSWCVFGKTRRKRSRRAHGQGTVVDVFGTTFRKSFSCSRSGRSVRFFPVELAATNRHIIALDD